MQAISIGLFVSASRQGETLILAVNLGHDSDTVGAVHGTACG
jgi:ADP-ribosylglycohydrolase